MSIGTLYGAFKRLLDLGWIVRLDDVDPKGNSHARRMYKLSQLGITPYLLSKWVQQFREQ